MARNIIIGTMSGKICATCSNWEGPNLLKSKGLRSNPSAMSLENTSYRALCIKRRQATQACSSCGNHEYNYYFERYL